MLVTCIFLEEFENKQQQILHNDAVRIILFYTLMLVLVLCGRLLYAASYFVNSHTSSRWSLCLDLWSLLLTLSISIEDCLHDCTCIPLFFSFLFLWSLLLSSSTRRRFSPQRSSGQAVVTGVVPSLPRYVPSIFIPHRVQHSHCSSILIECC